ncbi:MAG: DUF1178 family protein [Myxococcota bacterium]
MYIVDLQCDREHRFEGWYESASELRALEASGEVTCPLCEAPAHAVPTASRVSTSRTRPVEPQVPTAQSQVPAASDGRMPLEFQKRLAKVVQWVRQTHEDVGPAFADRAIAMHRGDEAATPIRGETNPEAEARLLDEGVPFLKLPIPDIEQN